jgi:REP element-mobilizing transposase RayT
MNGAMRMIAMAGRSDAYVIMPDHVYFFCSAELDAKTLPIFMQRWKEWTSKRIVREHAVAGIGDPGLKLSGNLWQALAQRRLLFLR